MLFFNFLFLEKLVIKRYASIVLYCTYTPCHYTCDTLQLCILNEKIMLICFVNHEKFIHNLHTEIHQIYLIFKI